MEEKNNILNQIKKSSKPDVPKDFFENFSDNLMSKIDETEQSFLNDLPKNDKPDVPKDFFNNFKVDIKPEQTKTTKVFKLKIWHVVSTAAAIFIGVLLLNQNSTIDTNLVADEISVDDTEIIVNEDLIAYIDENTLVDFIVNNNIQEETEIEEISDAIYDEISFGIDDYYYYD